MRCLVTNSGIAALLVLCGCSSGGTTTPSQTDRLAPPTLSISGTTRIVTVATGSPSLEVAASIQNRTSIHIQVAVGGGCPLFVRLFPDPTGEYRESLDASMACAAGNPTLDLSPGDSVVLTRVLGADTLASYSPGWYGVNLAVTTSTALIGVWGGAVQLPMSASH